MFIYLFEGPPASGKTTTATTFLENSRHTVIEADKIQAGVNPPIGGNLLIEMLDKRNYQAVLFYLKTRRFHDFTKIIITADELGFAESLSKQLGGFVIIKMSFQYVFVSCQ